MTETLTPAFARTAPARRARQDVTLRCVWLGFLRTTTAALLILAVLVAVLRRAAAGPVGWADAAVLAGLIAARPFAEWALHKLVLHGRPRHWNRITLDPLAAQAHRAHHANPRDPRHLLTPARVVVELVVLSWLATSWLPAPLDATALAAVLGFALAAEWTHALVHSAYRPRTAWLRGLVRRHRLHHHRNENYWFGLTSSAADRVLGTSPDPADVPVSTSTRTL
jgi:hypothetical protein